jgi:hypothetical protein
MLATLRCRASVPLAINLSYMVNGVGLVEKQAFSHSRAAPAQLALENVVKSFTAGRDQKPIYQGAGPEVDAAWLELYERKQSIISITSHTYKSNN